MKDTKEYSVLSGLRDLKMSVRIPLWCQSWIILEFLGFGMFIVPIRSLFKVHRGLLGLVQLEMALKSPLTMVGRLLNLVSSFLRFFRKFGDSYWVGP